MRPPTLSFRLTLRNMKLKKGAAPTKRTPAKGAGPAKRAKRSREDDGDAGFFLADEDERKEVEEEAEEEEVETADQLRLRLGTLLKLLEGMTCRMYRVASGAGWTWEMHASAAAASARLPFSPRLWPGVSQLGSTCRRYRTRRRTTGEG